MLQGRVKYALKPLKEQACFEPGLWLAASNILLQKNLR